MKITKILYVLIGCMLTTSFSIEGHERRYLSCAEPSRANNGKHGLKDGEDGEDGKIGKNGQNGGHGGNGGGSV